MIHVNPALPAPPALNSDAYIYAPIAQPWPWEPWTVGDGIRFQVHPDGLHVAMFAPLNPVGGNMVFTLSPAEVTKLRDGLTVYLASL